MTAFAHVKTFLNYQPYKTKLYLLLKMTKKQNTTGFIIDDTDVFYTIIPFSGTLFQSFDIFRSEENYANLKHENPLRTNENNSGEKIKK